MKINGYEINIKEEELNNILENKTRNIELISKDFEGYKALPEEDKKALEHLVRAAKIFNDIALEQDHPQNIIMKKHLEKAAQENSYAQKALELFNSLGGVAGHNGVEEKPIKVFKELDLLAGKNFYPEDLSVREFHQILLEMANKSKFAEIKKILSARTMVRRKDNELIAIDYTKYFSEQFANIAAALKEAAKCCTEPDFKNYLEWQIKALSNNDETLDMEADKQWALLQFNNLEFTISRENYADEMTGTVFDNAELLNILQKNNIEIVSKDTLGCRVGINNKQGTHFILESLKTLPHLAQWMPNSDKYEQSIGTQDAKQTMVDADLIALTGDYAQCRGGITTAQNLPNNDKLSVKTDGARRNVYHRQVRMSSDKQREQKLLNALVAKEFYSYFDAKSVHTFVIGHENGHSLGPLSEYQNSLGTYKHIIEEHKADVISIASMEELATKFNLFEKDYLKTIYTSWCVGLFLKAKPVFANPHRVADLIQFNYLLENNVIFFDENKKMHINFDLISPKMYDLLTETINIQLSKSANKAKEFIDRWAYWGETSEYIAKTQQKLGIKPFIKIITNF